MEPIGVLAGMRKSRRYNVIYVNFEHERQFLYLGPDGAFIMKHSLSFLCLKKYCIILYFHCMHFGGWRTYNSVQEIWNMKMLCSPNVDPVSALAQAGFLYMVQCKLGRGRKGWNFPHSLKVLCSFAQLVHCLGFIKESWLSMGYWRLLR